MKRCIICGNQDDDDSTVCEVCGNPYLSLDEDTHNEGIVEPDLELAGVTAPDQAEAVVSEQASEKERQPRTKMDGQNDKAAQIPDEKSAEQQEIPAREETKRGVHSQERTAERSQMRTSHRTHGAPQIYGQGNNQEMPGAGDATGMIRRDINGSAARRPGSTAGRPGSAPADARRRSAMQGAPAGERAGAANAQNAAGGPRRSANPQGSVNRPGGAAGMNGQPGARQDAQRASGVPGGVRGSNAPGGVRGSNAPGGMRGSNVPTGMRPSNAPGDMRASNMPGSGMRSPNMMGGAARPNGMPGGPARNLSFMSGKIKAESRRALRSPLLLLVAVLQTVYLAGSVAAIFMKELNFSLIMRLISGFSMPQQLTGYMDQLLNLMAKLDTDEVIINLVLHVPDLLLCIGLWAIVLAVRTKEEEMSGAGFAIIKVVVVIGLIKNGLVMIAGLVISVALTVSAWVSGAQGMIIAAVITLVIMITATMMVIMYYFSYFAMLGTFRANALEGESYGSASSYVAVVYIVMGLFGIVGLLAGIVNAEISGIVSSVGKIGWMVLFAVWIFTYRSKLGEVED